MHVSLRHLYVLSGPKAHIPASDMKTVTNPCQL